MDYVSLVYAAVVAVGGLIGYMKAGSIVSLLFGFSFGLVVAWATIKLPDKPVIVLGEEKVLL
jgi:uncharacterized membrane protein (UPF0136 family)